ncbi:RNase adapter RapZ [Roseisalinus antarcticus]|uniref:GlmZ(SRNA)-inactivating NTPase n=1 Tax=Roseisalinus antarcticus TaxID=254357 RepID=A0A1Y5SRJ5_9RHOB|nr:RNase adapter RapZ [Roseisalinus antarcticus]SLN45374.1 glmZ(sRNA)-inactivating NTPase [Roseisalinus antarcticus]
MTDPGHVWQSQKLVLVTGPSGAGRSTCINVLEDLGYEVIDNLPLTLAPRLMEGPPLGRPLALGLDVRNRDFGTDALVDLIDGFAGRQGLDAQVLYLDADEDTLVRRYSETRRRHPLAPNDPPLTGIQRERDLLWPIRSRADVLIDTSTMSPHDLRDEVERWYATDDSAGMGVSVTSFSYKRGLPRGLDLVFDCRFLRNPHWEPSLRGLTGRDPAVDSYVASDPRFDDFFTKVRDLVVSLLPAYRDEGKSHLSVGFGCTGGQHRSVALTERLAGALAAAGWQVSSRHRELERHAGNSGPTREAGQGMRGDGRP